MESADKESAAGELRTVEILKRPGQTLGFYIREGHGPERPDGVFISRIATGSVVESNGLLHVGDEIVKVNTVDVRRMGLDDVVILMSIPKRLVLSIRPHKGCKNASCPSLSHFDPEDEPLPVVVLKKGSTERCSDPGRDAKRTRGAGGKWAAKQQAADRGDDSCDSGMSSEASYTRSPHSDGHNVRPAAGQSSPRELAVEDTDYSPAAAHPAQHGIHVDSRKLCAPPKMGVGHVPQAFRSPHMPRRAQPAYPAPDYSSDTEARTYSYDIQPRLIPRNYDPNVIRAFQEEIERTHPTYLTTTRPPPVRTLDRASRVRTASPDRYNSDSEVINTMYRGSARGERTLSSRGAVEGVLAGDEERCNSLPHMDGSHSSHELKHWLRKFDNLSVELHRHEAPDTGDDAFGSRHEAPSYTSGEYWTWSQRHSSSPGQLPPALQQPLHVDTSPRQQQDVRRTPRVTRKLSADSLMDYRTYQLDEPEQGRAPPAGYQRTSPSVTSLSTASSRYRPPGYDQTDQCAKSADSSSGSRARDLQLTRKPLQIRPDEFRLYQPDIEERDSPLDKTVDGLLSVHILCGHGLKSSSRTVLRDLYCVVEVDAVNKARTMIRTGAINFDWDESFDVDIEHAAELSFSVYSWDPNTRHRLCYSGTLAIGAFLQYGNNQKIALKLEPKGILYVSIIYSEPAVSLRRAPSQHRAALFGVDLETVARRDKAGVPLIVRSCVQEVERRGLDHVGIYRLCGSARRKQQIKEEFEKNPRGVDLSPEAVSDINVITGVLKDFLRELPEPLFTNALYSMLLDSLSVWLPGDPTGSANLMLSVLECLPKANQDTTIYLFEHLKRVADKSDINKMNTSNLAVCFGPVLLCPATHVSQPAADFKKHIEVLRHLLDIWPHNKDSVMDTSDILETSSNGTGRESVPSQNEALSPAQLSTGSAILTT